MKIILFFYNKRGIKILQHLKYKHQILHLILSKKYLNDEICKYLKKNKYTFSIIDDVNNKKFIKKIKNLNPDLNILAGFPYIFKKELINIPKYGTINLHAGSLPNYRGGSPLNWQIINNEKYITLSIIKINSGIDTGPILNEIKFKLKKNYDINDIQKITIRKFPTIIDVAIKNLIAKKFSFQNIKTIKSKYWRQRKPSDGEVFWNKMTNIQVFNLVRSVTLPYPCAFSYQGNIKIKIIEVAISNISDNSKAGTVINKYKNTYVKCKIGYVKIIKISSKFNNNKNFNLKIK